MTGYGNTLRPDLGDIRFTYDLLRDCRVLLLDDQSFRALMALVAVSAAVRVWTYSEPDPEGLLDYSEQDFARICSMSVRRWRKVRPHLEKFFKIDDRGWVFDRDWLVIGNGDSRRPPILASLRSAVMQRDNYTCGYCGTKNGPFHGDHIVPYSEGGATDIENLICACATCNIDKRAMDLDEFIASRGNIINFPKKSQK